MAALGLSVLVCVVGCVRVLFVVQERGHEMKKPTSSSVIIWTAKAWDLLSCSSVSVS